MPELRWNPLLRTYTMVAANRQGRPHLPKGQCPFCPGSGQVPEQYEVLAYPNDFPTLSQQPDVPTQRSKGLYENAENYGVCEVILYSSDHGKSFSELSQDHIGKIVRLWAERYAELSKDERIKYIFPFENKGEEVGVTIHHPHGQLYAYPFVPHKLEIELSNCKKHWEEKGENLFAAMNAEEHNYGERVVAENASFIAYIPYFTDYPYGVFIVAKNERLHLAEMDGNEHNDLAELLKKITAGFDLLFDKPFPYMMCLHQAPVNSPEWADCSNYYRFHIEFYPPLRSADKIKWMASSETGAGAAANTLYVEDTAGELRAAIDRINTNGH